MPVTGYFTSDVGYDIENRGVEPDIDVDFTPQDYRNGTDPQLGRAIVEVMSGVNKAAEYSAEALKARVISKRRLQPRG